MSGYQLITAAELKAVSTEGAPLCLVDVRTSAEFSGEQISQSQCWPLQDIEMGVEMTLPNSDPVYLVCASGIRSKMAAEVLQNKIANPLYVISDGIAGCESAGFAIEKNGGVISLERQVRIAAGLFVLVGVLLGMLVNPSFYTLSAFVGAGLIFAGISNTCAMGLLLAKMPWNQAKGT